MPTAAPAPELAFRMHDGEVVRTAREFLVGAKLSRYADELLVGSGLTLAAVQAVTDGDLLRAGIAKEFHRRRFLREAKQLVPIEVGEPQPQPEAAEPQPELQQQDLDAQRPSAEEAAPPSDAAAAAAPAEANPSGRPMQDAEPEPQTEPQTEPEPQPEPLDDSLKPYGDGTGISADGLLHCVENAVEIFGKLITEDMSTSDLCKTLIQPATMPAGWTCEPELICRDDAGNDVSANGWYKHCYVETATGERHENRPPKGTHSMCERLGSDPATSHLIGKPTHFFSHAWLQKFLNNVTALRSFVESRPAGSSEVFFWYDCFAIDQHECQYPDPEKPRKSSKWWSETFLGAIGSIGGTVMMLSPWDGPTPLTRAWCLWELYCTIKTGSEFSACLGPAEQAAFEAALFSSDGLGPEKVLAAFAAIDVSEAEAGSPADRSMILDAAQQVDGGLRGLDNVAVAEMRKWFLSELKRLTASRVAVGADGSSDLMDLAIALKKLGELDEALTLYKLVAAAHEAAGDEDSLDQANGNIANCLSDQGRFAEARPIYHALVASFARRHGASNELTLQSRLNLAACMANQEDDDAARVELEAAAEGLEATLGPAHDRTLAARQALASQLYNTGDHLAAISAWEGVVATRMGSQGAGHWETLDAQAQLAHSMLELGRAPEAVGLLEVVAPALAAQLGAEHQHAAFAQLVLQEACRMQTHMQRNGLSTTQMAEIVAAEKQRSQQRAGPPQPQQPAALDDVEELVSWGFDRAVVLTALEATDGDKEVAINMLLQLQSAPPPTQGADEPGGVQATGMPANLELPTDTSACNATEDHERKQVVQPASQKLVELVEPEPQPEPDQQPEPQTEPEPQPEPLDDSLKPYGDGTGISADGLLHCVENAVEIFGKLITEDMSTSDLCKTLIQPATMPAGWTCEPELICRDDAGNDVSANGWYKHCYVETATGERHENRPPKGTHSMCERLGSDPATSHLIGKPTHFFSHAWLQKFLNNVTALRSFVESRPAGSSEVFFWYDCFAIDQHECQYPDPEKPRKSSKWWSETFLGAIGSIGGTVMMLSPWDGPTPLTRAWCLWELYCTIKTGSEFSACLGPAEQAAFEAALFEDGTTYRTLFAAFAAIDVSEAEAGSPADRSMILDAAQQVDGGLHALDNLAVAEMRKWFLAQVRRLAQVRLDRGGEQAAIEIGTAANALKDLGEGDEALQLHALVAASFAAGGNQAEVDGANFNIATTLLQQGNAAEARYLKTKRR
eukprot:COSAG06_NODE_98_length_24155_cov_29.681784_2_plen_1250_part_00